MKFKYIEVKIIDNVLSVIANENEKPLKENYTNDNFTEIKCEIDFNIAIKQWIGDNKVFNFNEIETDDGILTYNYLYTNLQYPSYYEFNIDLEKGIKVDCIEIINDKAYFKKESSKGCFSKESSKESLSMNKDIILQANDSKVYVPVAEIKSMRSKYKSASQYEGAYILLEITKTSQSYMGFFPTIEEAKKCKDYNPTMTICEVRPVG